jgi:hypothetical protein
VTDGKDSETRTEGIRVLGLIVVIVSMAATSFILISEGLQAAAAVAALVMIPLFILSIQLDSGRGQRVAVMTALVGVLALIATLVIVRPSEHESQPGPTETPPSTPTSPTSPTPPEPSPTPQAPTSKPPRPPSPSPSPTLVGWVKAWKGPFRLPHISGIDLDTAPPSYATGRAGNLDQGDLFYDNRDALFPKLVPHAWVAIPESHTRPDANACDAALETLRNNDPFEPQPGQYLCIGTASGRLAWLEVTDVSEYDYVRFNVVTWKWKE